MTAALPVFICSVPAGIPLADANIGGLIRAGGKLLADASPSTPGWSVLPVVLVGLPGSGKTSVGALLAAELGWSFADVDHRVEEASGQTIADLVAEKGWPLFRDVEQNVLVELLQRDRIVIATGGGVVDRADNRGAILRRARVVWLQAGIPVLLERLGGDPTRRPLLASDPEKRLTELSAARQGFYAELADASVSTDRMEPEAVARHLAGLVASEWSGRRP